MTFGIPVFAVPWVGGGDKQHMRWIEERKYLESDSSAGKFDCEYDDYRDDEDFDEYDDSMLMDTSI